ncbi:MAG: response regulator [Dehalococcoidia bacterium]
MKLSTLLRPAAWCALPVAFAASVSWDGRDQRPDGAGEAASAAGRQLLARISQAVRTPINAVISTAERLLEGELNAEQREQVLTIQSSGRALREIVNELLDSAQAGSAGREPERAPSPLPVPLRTPPKPAATAARAAGGRRQRVLVVEHIAADQFVAQRTLEREGYAVEIASSGREALMALERGLFDIVLMDCSMPEMDGFEATRRIRERFANRRRIPVIAVTAEAPEDGRERRLAAGMDGGLQRPLDRAGLSAMLERWLAGESERRAA